MARLKDRALGFTIPRIRCLAQIIVLILMVGISSELNAQLVPPPNRSECLGNDFSNDVNNACPAERLALENVPGYKTREFIKSKFFCKELLAATTNYSSCMTKFYDNSVKLYCNCRCIQNAIQIFNAAKDVCSKKGRQSEIASCGQKAQSAYNKASDECSNVTCQEPEIQLAGVGGLLNSIAGFFKKKPCENTSTYDSEAKELIGILEKLKPSK